MKEKWDEVEARMKALQIEESELVEKFILGSGKGGQKVNKTHSCVYLKHIPSGHEVKCQKTRSRELNRIYARRELVAILEEEILKIKSRKKMLVEKIKRQKRKRSKRAQEKILQKKRERAQVKQMRRPPSE